jgi:hypothetical protein
MSAVLKNVVAREVAKIVLKAKYPNLTMVGPEDSPLVIAAKNIRAELKAAFPSIKFSVRTERFSMGNAIRIGWTDGPNTKQVEAITDKYQAGEFNGMEDIYEYSRSDWKDAFGSGKYITTSRDYSASLIESAITIVCKRFGADPITVEEYKKGAAWRWETPGSNARLGEELNRILFKLSRAATLGFNASSPADPQQ